jgi:hypothetical protein
VGELGRPQEELAPATSVLVREIRQSFELMGLMAGMLTCYLGLGLLAVRVFA